MSSSLDFPLTVSARNDLSNFKTGMIAFSIVNEEIQSDGTFNSDNLDEIIIQLKNCIDQVTPHYFFMKFNHNQDNLNCKFYL